MLISPVSDGRSATTETVGLSAPSRRPAETASASPDAAPWRLRSDEKEWRTSRLTWSMRAVSSSCWVRGATVRRKVPDCQASLVETWAMGWQVASRIESSIRSRTATPTVAGTATGRTSTVLACRRPPALGRAARFAALAELRRIAALTSCMTSATKGISEGVSVLRLEWRTASTCR